MIESERFDRCLTCVLQFEGGFVDDPRDNGKATKFGITLRTLGHWLGHEVVAEDVRSLNVETAAEIYRKQYWHVTGCDQLPPGLDLMVFDCAVNQGTTIAGRFLQQAVGVSVDGLVGPRTIAAAKARPALDLINSVSAYRRERYRGNPNFPVYGKGWLRRLDSITASATNDATPVQHFT
jgi:lysozyme family protein